MFRFTQEPSSGSQIQCLPKITRMVPLCLSIRALPVLWQRPRRVGRYCDSTFLHGELHKHTQQIGICHHNTDNAHIDKRSGTIPVILARH